MADPTLAEWLGKSPSEPFAQTDLDKLVAGFHSVGLGSVVESAIVPILRPFLGKPIASLPTTIKIDPQHPALSIVPHTAQSAVTDAVGGVLGGIFAPLAGLAAYAAALLLLVTGLWLYSRGQPQKLTVTE